MKARGASCKGVDIANAAKLERARHLRIFPNQTCSVSGCASLAFLRLSDFVDNQVFGGGPCLRRNGVPMESDLSGWDPRGKAFVAQWT